MTARKIDGMTSISLFLTLPSLFLPFNYVELLQVHPNTIFKEGDRFNFEPWGSRCMVSFERGELIITNKSYKTHRDHKIKIEYFDQKILCNGGHTDIYWTRKGYKRLEMRDRDTIAVRWDGGGLKNFTRVPVSCRRLFMYLFCGSKEDDDGMTSVVIVHYFSLHCHHFSPNIILNYSRMMPMNMMW